MLSYRADIQGLRAIAVLSVIIYHLNLGILQGGFVGVDVFFVISGYLISKSIYADLATDTFSIVNFYVRRAKRILPAFFTTLILSSVFAYSLFFPTELVDYAKSAIASALFSANIYFYATQSYFSPQANEIPLLHFWSLGIEEQFYLFFPLLMVGIYKYRPSKLPAIISVILLSSLCGSILMVSHHPSAAFYLLPFRAFELLIGSALALPIFSRTLTSSCSIMLNLLGLAIFTFATFCFNDKIAFPGIAAFIPCMATALMIFSGQNTGNRLTKLLSSQPLTYIGKISYSLYLVHWPIIVFGQRLFMNTNPTLFACISFVLSFVLAFLSYQLVEQPFLIKGKTAGKTVKTVATASSALATILLPCAFIIEKQGFQASLDAKVASILSYSTYHYAEPYRQHTCFLEPEDRPDKIDMSSCLPNPKEGKKVILWGDSHAIHLFPGLEKTLRQQGYSVGVFSSSACPPIIGIDVASRPLCKAFNRKVLPIILKENPEMLIMSANWVADEPTMNLLEETIKTLSSTQMKLIVLGQTPIYSQSVPTIIASRLKAKNRNTLSDNELLNDFLANSETVMKKRFSNRRDVTYISVMDIVCKNNKCPLLTSNSVPVHFDSAHLTVDGSELFADYLTPYILS